MTSDYEYRARKAIEWRFTRGWSNRRIAEELDVAEQTVSEYINDPPDALKEPVKQFKEELTLGTFNRLRDQLAAAIDRAENADRPQKVFEFDDNGNLVTEEIVFDNGRTKLVPKVAGMEMQPDHKARAMARREEREIIDMLWSLAGAEEPDKVEHSGTIEGIAPAFVDADTTDESDTDA